MNHREELIRAFELLSTAKAMTEIYEANFKLVSKYVHATSRGHEAIQIAIGTRLLPQDFLSAYYRDDALLLAIGMRPFDLMLQLMAKKNDPFSGGRSYYSHPSLKDLDKPKIPHQSSATGMQAIPSTGIAMGIQYKEKINLNQNEDSQKPIVVCSLGDASITEGEVAEAFHMASFKQLPILYLIQDNQWDISAHASEIRRGDAIDYIKGFPGIEYISIDGTEYEQCAHAAEMAINYIRKNRKPFLLHAKVPLLNHHTSGVRKEWYRDDLEKESKKDPFPKLQELLKLNGISNDQINEISQAAFKKVEDDFLLAKEEEDPSPQDLYTHDYAPTPIKNQEIAHLFKVKKK